MIMPGTSPMIEAISEELSLASPFSDTTIVRTNTGVRVFCNFSSKSGIWLSAMTRERLIFSIF